MTVEPPDVSRQITLEFDLKLARRVRLRADLREHEQGFGAKTSADLLQRAQPGRRILKTIAVRPKHKKLGCIFDGREHQFIKLSH